MKKKFGSHRGVTETVTVRFTPETKRIAEIKAKEDLRTLSNYIEVVLEKSVVKTLGVL